MRKVKEKDIVLIEVEDMNDKRAVEQKNDWDNMNEKVELGQARSRIG